jgi:hypothetical protein
MLKKCKEVPQKSAAPESEMGAIAMSVLELIGDVVDQKGHVGLGGVGR